MNPKFKLLFLAIVFLTHHVQAQDATTKIIKATPQLRAAFYKFMIPASVNGSDLAPSAQSSLNIDFGDDKLEFKYGRLFDKRTSENKNKEGSNALKNSFFLSANVGAPNGTATLFKYDNAPLEFGFKGGVTFIVENTFWTYTRTGKRSSERFHWINIIPKINFSNLNIFSSDTSFVEKSAMNYSVMVSYNGYFHSVVDKYKWKNGIFSVGAGVGRINNYKQLSEITMEKGLVTVRPDGTSYFSKTDETAGRLGTFKEITAFLYNAEGFKSIIRTNTFTWYLGLSGSGYAGRETVLNGNFGNFFSFSSIDDAGERMEKFGFSVNGSLRNLNKLENSGGFRDNFIINISANLPLNFQL